jgi:diphthine-ammonia ligase
MQNLQVAALVSGGKDSTMNMMRCAAQGHKIVCLGNLFPAPSECDELDSFMYQTVGHDGIEAIAACMELPLYRRPIQRKRSLNQDLEYSTTEGDEVEDLFALLQYIKGRHPEINAVATGAILSNYQRTRVEAVCMRLGLVSLSFLWQCDQAELLDEMIDSGAAVGCSQATRALAPPFAAPALGFRPPALSLVSPCVICRHRGKAHQDCMHGAHAQEAPGKVSARCA